LFSVPETRNAPSLFPQKRGLCIFLFPPYIYGLLSRLIGSQVPFPVHGQRASFFILQPATFPLRRARRQVSFFPFFAMLVCAGVSFFSPVQMDRLLQHCFAPRSVIFSFPSTLNFLLGLSPFVSPPFPNANYMPLSLFLSFVPSPSLFANVQALPPSHTSRYSFFFRNSDAFSFSLFLLLLRFWVLPPFLLRCCVVSFPPGWRISTPFFFFPLYASPFGPILPSPEAGSPGNFSSLPREGLCLSFFFLRRTLHVIFSFFVFAPSRFSPLSLGRRGVFLLCAGGKAIFSINLLFFFPPPPLRIVYTVFFRTEQLSFHLSFFFCATFYAV